MTELCEVVITAPDPEWLKDFSRKLVEQRLCASAHNFAPVQSIYRWRGEIYERTEGRVEWEVLEWNNEAIDFYQGLGARPMAGWTKYRWLVQPSSS